MISPSGIYLKFARYLVKKGYGGGGGGGLKNPHWNPNIFVTWEPLQIFNWRNFNVRVCRIHQIEFTQPLKSCFKSSEPYDKSWDTFGIPN